MSFSTDLVEIPDHSYKSYDTIEEFDVDWEADCGQLI